MIIEVSVGEVVDKLSILKIKLEKIKDQNKLDFVQEEYQYLKKNLLLELDIDISSPEFLEMYSINKKLWDIEDKIRDKERKKEFDQEFIELARSVYITNDRRSEVKKKINEMFDSEFMEVKSYEKY